MNQQEQIQPDYNYILNQDAPLPPKKRSFKLPIIAGLFLLSLLIIAVIVASLQVDPVKSPDVTTGHSSAAQLFVGSLEKKEYGKIAKTQLASNLAALTDRNDLTLERMAKNLDIKSCKLIESKAQQADLFSTVYNCNTIEANQQRILTITTVKVEGVYKVSAYKAERK